MNRVVILFGAAVVAATCTAGGAEHPSTNHTRVTEKAAKEMARQAKSPEEYLATAEYYRRLHDDYEGKATAEKAEWILRAQHPWLKNPSSDSARGLYEYYSDKAAKMTELSSK